MITRLAEKETRNRLLFVCCWQPTVQEDTLVQFVRLTNAGQVKSDCFNRNLEAFGKVITVLTVVIFYGRHQSLIIQNQWPATAVFITKGGISLPELLEAMPGSRFNHRIMLNSWPIRQLDATADKPNKLIKQTPAVFLDATRSMTDMFATYLHWSRTIPYNPYPQYPAGQTYLGFT